MKILEVKYNHVCIHRNNYVWFVFNTTYIEQKQLENNFHSLLKIIDDIEIIFYELSEKVTAKKESNFISIKIL